MNALSYEKAVDMRAQNGYTYLGADCLYFVNNFTSSFSRIVTFLLLMLRSSLLRLVMWWDHSQVKQAQLKYLDCLVLWS